MNTNIKHYLSLFLALFLMLSTASCQNDDDTSTIVAKEYAPITRALTENTELVSQVFTDTTFIVAPGVEETDIHYLSMKGLTMRLFILKADLEHEGVSLAPLTPYGSTGYAMQTVPEMLKWPDEPGQKAVAAVNADFFNMETGEPRGIVHINGEAIRTTPLPGRSFFGTTTDGEIIIAHTDDYPEMQDKLRNALGGGDLLIKDHTRTSITNKDVHPRTAVGITDDNVLYFIAVDGRQFDYSNGMTLSEVTDIFEALGAKDAANLDGGGSTTFVTLHSRADVYHIRNRPSDGTPRPVGNGWAITVTEQ
ncbi:phosphodiester glycosidase family protein [Sinomicrobium weinanense]|uniref:Phosphodiester glycosidase family protein n=1 Tax=Sinomicrobium weinanense TaxID=2842200 RepID=A0A926JU94_9FLAO|nr:phosphodiester glycosidase family protein [Sinomicrobium weinanense]MBC9797429.1 phosphodiester glycosidase family protein [Sinomicrobium weinanense]MBU3123077.1 phosphodiester glycosidase family protein [Sinomicrobium weinanense]